MRWVVEEEVKGLWIVVSSHGSQAMAEMCMHGRVKRGFAPAAELRVRQKPIGESPVASA